jgi:hypothetical protein
MNLYTKMKLHEATDSIEDGIRTKRSPDPIYNWFFNPEKENYSHKVVDFANARYQPTTVDIKNDPYYRSQTKSKQESELDNNDLGASPQGQVAVGPAQATAQPTLQDKVQPLQVAQVPVVQPQNQLITTQPPILEQNVNPAEQSVVIEKQVVVQTSKPEVKVMAQNDQAQRLEKERELFKETIAMSGDKEPVVQQGIVESFPIDVVKNKPVKKMDRRRGADVDIRKRNRLKEFLSQNPALSHNHLTGESSTRKGLA